jgi:predicted O-linked N-acetylglucosamine transferase (SPINDLY family)
MSSELVQLVSTTRLEEGAFWRDTLLGRSLRQPQHRQLVARIRFANRQPLAVAYNAAIAAAPTGAVLVFCHDDVDLGPEPLGPQLEEALARFDLVGVAGNQRHQSGQARWWLDPRSGGWDHPFLSGALRHGTPGAAQLTVYGPAPMPVQLLDGVFLAARADTLRHSGVRFDPRFDFHYYDLDVCRSARRAGLSLGTWPLLLLHAHGRDASGLAWSAMQQSYLRKWGEGNESGGLGQLQELFRSARAQENAGAWPEAERRYRQLLERAPGHGVTRLQLAKVLHRQGRDREALALLDGLLDGLSIGAGQPVGDGLPEFTDARLVATTRQPARGERSDGSSTEAPAAFRARAHTNRGALLQLLGDLDAAQRDYGEALRLEPSLKIAGDNLLALALLLRGQGRSHQALEALRMILRATPQRPDLLLQLGTTLMDLGRVEAAVPCFRRLLRQEPQLREGHYQLGQALAALGHTEAGIAELESALALDPEATEVLVQLEMQRLSLCHWDDYGGRIARLLAQLEARGQARAAVIGGGLVPPLSLNLFPAPLDLHRRLGERWAEPTSRTMEALRLPPAPPRQPGERWRIGYLSADFRNHAMGNLLHGLFTCHDRRRFEVFAYSLADVCDEVTEVIRSGVDHYAMVAADSSEVIAQRIRADGIDVLIDLMGHTHHGRPGVLALRPAPLQLHYLGYPGTLGADWIDGVIADAWLIPPEHEIHHRETVHRLPWGFVSSGPLPDAADSGPPPPSREALGLPADGGVYACFNRPEKITPAVFAGWLEILRQVPGSVLWIINDQPRVEERLRARLVAAGLEPQRLRFSPKVESAAFGQHCALADLLLDTSPYGSGATAVTALAAGLPLLTCPGDTFAARLGASLCAATGLEELICPTPEAYQERAIALGRQPAELGRLRRQLLERHGELPLFNTAAWVGHLESLLERLLATVC